MLKISTGKSRNESGQISKTGGPGVMHYKDVDLDDPGSGQMRLRHTAIGIDDLDTCFRAGARPPPQPGICERMGC